MIAGLGLAHGEIAVQAAWWGTALAAAFVGSLHCAGMCGGFAAVVGGPCSVGGDGRRSAGRALTAQLAYGAGRAGAYVTLGALAGATGATLQRAGVVLTGVQGAASLLMGLTLIGLGVHALWPALGARLVGSRGAQDVSAAGGRADATTPLVTLRRPGSRPSALTLLRALWTGMARRRDPAAAFAIGVLSGLLPCGLLWSFLAAAAATATVLGGAGTMLALFLGTAPALLFVGLASTALARQLGPWAPRLVGVAMIALGAIALADRVERIAPAATATHAPCH